MINLKSYAKINLYLDIGKKLDNGYHRIETIFQTINLFDEIKIERINKPVYQIKCNHPEVPIGKDSLVYRAIEIMMKGKNAGLAVSIHKNIPIASGLGGGSSNIATILIGISKLFHLEISLAKLMDIATCFGMDIPFFIERGTVYAQGRGEILFPLKPINPPMHLILVNPGIKISTQWAYQAFDQEPMDDPKKLSLDIHRFLNKRKSIQFYELSKIIYNRFDLVVCKKFPIINHIKSQLQEMGALYIALSGSGPTVYGILENRCQADNLYLKIKNQYPIVYRTSTVRANNVISENDY